MKEVSIAGQAGQASSTAVLEILLSVSAILKHSCPRWTGRGWLVLPVAGFTTCDDIGRWRSQRCLKHEKLMWLVE